MGRAGVRPRNDPAQYDDLATEWWRPGGTLAALQWIAAARAPLIPPAARRGAVLVDLACGGGLTAPYVAAKGYRHVGVDLTVSALRLARGHGVSVLRGDVLHLPLADGVADVVVAGEMLEHVTDLRQAVAEACRVLRPQGTLVLDTLADTRMCRFLLVTALERVQPTMRGIHDPALFVDREELVETAAAHGVPLTLNGLRPSLRDGARWLVARKTTVRMLRTRSTGMLFQGVGVKRPADRPTSVH